MPEKDPREEAVLKAALRLLGASAKSRSELNERLRDKGHSSGVIQKILTRLEREGFLNDRRLAAQLVTKFTEAKPSGKRKLAFELKRKGIPQDLREEALEKLDEEQEAESASRLARRKWKSLQRLPIRNRQKRIFDLLIRRGFGYQTARETIETLSSDENNE